VFDWPSTLEFGGLEAKISKATLLAGGTSVSFEQEGGRLRIELPPQAPDRYVSVLELETEN